MVGVGVGEFVGVKVGVNVGVAVNVVDGVGVLFSVVIGGETGADNVSVIVLGIWVAGRLVGTSNGASVGLTGILQAGMSRMTTTMNMPHTRRPIAFIIFSSNISKL
jgi:hypothetical protein